jgi:signal transduction histidine kinase
MKIKTKLTLGFLGVAILCVVVGYVGYTGSTKIIEDFDIIVDETAPELVSLGKVKALTHSLQTEAVSLALLPLIKGSADELQEELEEFEEVNRRLDEALLGKEDSEEGDVQELDEDDEDEVFEKIKTGKSKLYRVALELVRVAKEGLGTEAILAAKEKLEVEEEALSTILKTRLASETQELRKRDDLADDTATRTKTGILMISVAAVLLAFLLGFFISRSIVVPLSRLRTATIAMSQGDLSVRSDVKSADEVGELAVSFNHMADSIQNKSEELQTFNEELQTTNEELKSTSEELEATNEELKASNEEIRETQEKMLRQEKLAAVGQLASGIGHELRNPLGVMKNAVYFLKTKIGLEDEKIAKHLKIMEKEIDSSTKIISDLLGFSKTQKPAMAPNDINRAVEEALAVVEVPPNVQIAKNLNLKLPQALFDPDQIRQVFLNLILNAIQAMHEGGGMLNIATRLAGATVEIEFKDSGAGIPQENLKKLFDPFFTTKARGVGLGLAVSHGIIERHQGKLSVGSVVAQGTTMTVSLPTG